MLLSRVFVVVSSSSQLVLVLVFDGYLGTNGTPRKLLENPPRERPKQARTALTIAPGVVFLRRVRILLLVFDGKIDGLMRSSPLSPTRRSGTRAKPFVHSL